MLMMLEQPKSNSMWTADNMDLHPYFTLVLPLTKDLLLSQPMMPCSLTRTGKEYRNFSKASRLTIPSKWEDLESASTLSTISLVSVLYEVHRDDKSNVKYTIGPEIIFGHS